LVRDALLLFRPWYRQEEKLFLMTDHRLIRQIVSGSLAAKVARLIRKRIARLLVTVPVVEEASSMENHSNPTSSELTTQFACPIPAS